MGSLVAGFGRMILCLSVMGSCGYGSSLGDAQPAAADLRFARIPIETPAEIVQQIPHLRADLSGFLGNLQRLSGSFAASRQGPHVDGQSIQSQEESSLLYTVLTHIARTFEWGGKPSEIQDYLILDQARQADFDAIAKRWAHPQTFAAFSQKITDIILTNVTTPKGHNPNAITATEIEARFYTLRCLHAYLDSVLSYGSGHGLPHPLFCDEIRQLHNAFHRFLSLWQQISFEFAVAHKKDDEGAKEETSSLFSRMMTEWHQNGKNYFIDPLKVAGEQFFSAVASMDFARLSPVDLFAGRIDGLMHYVSHLIENFLLQHRQKNPCTVQGETLSGVILGSPFGLRGLTTYETSLLLQVVSLSPPDPDAPLVNVLGLNERVLRVEAQARSLSMQWDRMGYGEDPIMESCRGLLARLKAQSTLLTALHQLYALYLHPAFPCPSSKVEALMAPLSRMAEVVEGSYGAVVRSIQNTGRWAEIAQIPVDISQFLLLPT